METKQEIRQFRGKDILVDFTNVEFNPVRYKVHVQVLLNIDGCEFRGWALQEDKETAYTQAIECLKIVLNHISNGHSIISLENEFSRIQEELHEAKHEKSVVDWFLNFTKDKD